jgi:hypothetical protein
LGTIAGMGRGGGMGTSVFSAVMTIPSAFKADDEVIVRGETDGDEEGGMGEAEQKLFATAYASADTTTVEMGARGSTDEI